ncbi:unnamed protein product [Eruca vesicaria subsp. sativa]|uniref:Uncharacterized protein n=1 Tax=Eruca vesicaria subsp. sativa TaxID=29727 RepID=A0ABC8JE08_ERUVS|nr:unnamed protein product [Eruca vesicaria subsp. sativa]
MDIKRYVFLLSKSSSEFCFFSLSLGVSSEILSSRCCCSELLPFMYGRVGPFQEAIGLESLRPQQFRQVTMLTPENVDGFMSLLEIPPTQAVELLHFTDSRSLYFQTLAVTGIGLIFLHRRFTRALTFPSNSALLERFSVSQEKITRQEG